MKKLLIVCLCMLMVCQSVYAADITATDVIATPTDVATTPSEKVYCNATLEDDFADDCVIVVLNKEYTHKRIDFTPSHFPGVEISSIESLMSLSKTSKKLPTDLERESVSNDEFREIIRINLQKKDKQNVLDTIKKLEKIEFIKSAEPDYKINIDNDILTNQSNKKIQSTSSSYTATTYSDPLSSYQYAIDLINLPEAWNITTGTSNVNVGVIDTGISEHIDLEGNVDRTLGQDFLDSKDDTLDDESGHGTRVAGIIGAIGDNSVGICGVNWDVSIVPLQVVDSVGDLSTTLIINAIQYSRENNIPIINCSFGGYFDICYYHTAIQNYYGLVVCSAGNNGVNTDVVSHLPSNCTLDNVISVANSNQYDELSASSNYGVTTVDLAAPGCAVYTTSNNNNYTNSYSGTSLSAPFVTGVAALIKSCYPSLTTAQIKRCILNGVDKVDSLTGKVLTGGRLNAYKSLMLAQETQANTIVSGNFNNIAFAEPACFRKVGTNKTQLIVWDTLSDANFFNNNIMWEGSSFNCDKIQDRVIAGDFNGDFFDDIAVMYDYGSNNSSIMVWNGSSSGITFTNTAWSGNSFNASSVNAKMVAGDFNGDGYDDVAAFYDCGNSQTNLYLWRGSSTGLAYHGMIWTAPSFNAGCILGTVTAGDLNGDGKDDIAAFYDYGEASRLFVWKGTASGVSLLTGSACWYSSAFDSGNTRYKISCGDYDFDGKDDISVFYDCGNTTTKLFVWYGSSTATSCVEIDNNHGTWVSNTFVASYINRRVTSLCYYLDIFCSVWYTYDGESQMLRSNGTSFVWEKHV